MPDTTTGIRFASAMSELADTGAAADAVAQELKAQFAGAVDLVVVFASAQHVRHIPRIQEQLQSALSPGVILGVTAEGVIGVRKEIEDTAGLSVLAASLPGARLHPFSYQELDWPAALESPSALAQQINPRNIDLRAIILLADPYSTPLVKLLPMLDEAFPGAGVPVVGGMASSGQEPGQNRLLFNGKVLQEGAVGVAIGGHVRADCTVSQGCRPIGRPYVITKSQRHLVQELGGTNAMQAIQEMAQELPESDQQLLQSQPLLVGRVINEYKDRFGRGDFLIRGLMGVDQQAGYVAIGDPQTRVGQTIQFHLRDQKTAREDFSLLLEAQKLHGPAGGALLFSCNGRGSRLFDSPNADAQMVHDALGDVPIAGFFAAGEIGPVGNQNFVHGHTASLIVFRPAIGDES